MAGSQPGKPPQRPEKLDFSGLFLLVRGRSSDFLTGNFNGGLRKIRVLRHGIRFAGPHSIP